MSIMHRLGPQGLRAWQSGRSADDPWGASSSDAWHQRVGAAIQLSFHVSRVQCQHLENSSGCVRRVTWVCPCIIGQNQPLDGLRSRGSPVAGAWQSGGTASGRRMRSACHTSHARAALVARAHRPHKHHTCSRTHVLLAHVLLWTLYRRWSSRRGSRTGQRAGGAVSGATRTVSRRGVVAPNGCPPAATATTVGVHSSDQVTIHIVL